MKGPVESVGHHTRFAVLELGRHAVFALRILGAGCRPPFRLRRFIDDVFDSGVLSVTIICVSGLAVGMVLGLQFYLVLARFGSEESLGGVVGLALVRELGPVLTALLVTGRAGSAVAAEIGTMVVTEELDGLRMLSIDPLHFIVMPKALALLFVMPLLSAIFIVCAIGGAFVAGSVVLGVDGGNFITSLQTMVDFENDIVGSLLKATIFGAVLGLIATYRGYHSAPTSRGVSAATTQTVVVSSVCVLIFDYFITALWGF